MYTDIVEKVENEVNLLYDLGGECSPLGQSQNKASIAKAVYSPRINTSKYKLKELNLAYNKLDIWQFLATTPPSSAPAGCLPHPWPPSRSQPSR